MKKSENLQLLYDLNPQLYLFIKDKAQKKKVTLTNLYIKGTQILEPKRGVYYYLRGRNSRFNIYQDGKRLYPEACVWGDKIAGNHNDFGAYILKITII